MGRNNQSHRGFSRGRNINTREKNIRFLILTEDTKSSKLYLEAVIKEVRATCWGSKVVGIAKNSVIKGCGMSTTRLLKEAQSIKDSELTPFDSCWLVFDKDDFHDFDKAIREAKDAGFGVAWSNESFELWYLLHFKYQSVVIPRDKCIIALEEEIQRYKSSFKYDKGSSTMHAILAEYGNREQAIKNAERLQEMYQDTDYSSRNPCTHVDELIKAITDPEQRKKILKKSRGKNARK